MNVKKLWYIKKEKLISWNNKMDKILYDVLKDIYWKFDNFNKEVWNKILCKDVDNYKESIDTEDLREKIGKLQEFYDFNFNLTLWLKWKSLSETISILNEFWQRIELNIVSINTILNKCKNKTECKEIVNKFWQWIELDIVSINTILNKCENIWEIEELSNLIDIKQINKNEFFENSFIKKIAQEYKVQINDLYDFLVKKDYEEVDEDNWM